MHTATQEPKEPSFPPSGWLTKQTAADRLNLSVSRVFALGEAKKIKTQGAKSPTSGQMITLFHEGDIERMVFERQNPEASRLPVKQEDEFSDFAKSGGWAVRGLPRIAAPEEPAKPKDKLWLTVDEAAEYTGLPASTILEMVKNTGSRLNLPCLPAIDCGPRPGGKWRIKKSDLDKLEAV